jgi:hypothetical protein
MVGPRPWSTIGTVGQPGSLSMTRPRPCATRRSRHRGARPAGRSTLRSRAPAKRPATSTQFERHVAVRVKRVGERDSIVAVGDVPFCDKNRRQLLAGQDLLQVVQHARVRQRQRTALGAPQDVVGAARDDRKFAQLRRYLLGAVFSEADAEVADSGGIVVEGNVLLLPQIAAVFLVSCHFFVPSHPGHLLVARPHRLMLPISAERRFEQRSCSTPPFTGYALVTFAVD